jgi:hypothetical protein
MWPAHEVFVCVLLKEGSLTSAMQIRTWQGSCGALAKSSEYEDITL